MGAPLAAKGKNVLYSLTSSPLLCVICRIMWPHLPCYILFRIELLSHLPVTVEYSPMDAIVTYSLLLLFASLWFPRCKNVHQAVNKGRCHDAFLIGMVGIDFGNGETSGCVDSSLSRCFLSWIEDNKRNAVMLRERGHFSEKITLSILSLRAGFRAIPKCYTPKREDKLKPLYHSPFVMTL
jgi:hypothetical protein